MVHLQFNAEILANVQAIQKHMFKALVILKMEYKKKTSSIWEYCCKSIYTKMSKPREHPYVLLPPFHQTSQAIKHQPCNLHTMANTKGMQGRITIKTIL